MAAGEATSGRRLALTTLAAGLVGTLAGTIVGGLISLAAVNRSIRAEEASDLRASRQEIYSIFVADLNAFGRLLAGAHEDGVIDSDERSRLADSNDDFARSLAAALLVASSDVSDAINGVQKALENYVQVADAGGDTDEALRQMNQAAEVYVIAAKEDLGAA